MPSGGLSVRACQTLVKNIDQPVFVFDPEGTIQSVNPAFEETTGYSAEEVVGQNASMLHAGRHSDHAFRDMWRTLQVGDTWKGMVVNRRKNGSLHRVHQTITPMEDEQGDLLGYVVLNVDLNPPGQASSNGQSGAASNQVDEHPNYAQVLARLQHSLDKLKQDSTRSFTLMYFELNDFRRLINSRGEDVGTWITDSITRRLEEHIRPGIPSDKNTIVPLPNGEFVLLLDDTTQPKDAQTLAPQIMNLIRKPISVDGEEIQVDATGGVVFSSPEYDNADTMIRDAKTALHRAQREDSDVAFFTISMEDDLLHKFQMETDLQKALQENEFELYYQPIVDLRTDEVDGFEALIRWHHPEDGMLEASEFIPEAEKSGLIIPVGRWVLNEALDQLQTWRSEGLMDEDLALSVNLSPLELSEADFLGAIEELLEEKDVARESIYLEFTESPEVENPERLDERIQKLSTLGLRLCVDDFGSGYSTMERLVRWPIDFMKIDGTFIQGMTEDEQKRNLTRSLLDFADRNEMDVIAEGVEDAEESDLLKEWGCPAAQGFFYAEPMPAGEVTEFLRESKREPQPAR